MQCSQLYTGDITMRPAASPPADTMMGRQLPGRAQRHECSKIFRDGVEVSHLPNATANLRLHDARNVASNSLSENSLFVCQLDVELLRVGPGARHGFGTWCSVLTSMRLRLRRHAIDRFAGGSKEYIDNQTLIHHIDYLIGALHIV